MVSSRSRQVNKNKDRVTRRRSSAFEWERSQSDMHEGWLRQQESLRAEVVTEERDGTNASEREIASPRLHPSASFSRANFLNGFETSRSCGPGAYQRCAGIRRLGLECVDGSRNGLSVEGRRALPNHNPPILSSLPVFYHFYHLTLPTLTTPSTQTPLLQSAM